MAHCSPPGMIQCTEPGASPKHLYVPPTNEQILNMNKVSLGGITK